MRAAQPLAVVVHAAVDHRGPDLLFAQRLRGRRVHRRRAIAVAAPANGDPAAVAETMRSPRAPRSKGTPDYARSVHYRRRTAPHPDWRSRRRRRRRRRAGRRGDHRADLPAAPRSRRSSRSASSTSSRCCSSPPSGASGSALPPRWPAPLAFNFFHLPPTGRFTIADGRELGRARRLLDRRGRRPARWPSSRAPRTREAERAPPRGRPRRRDGARCCSAARASPKPLAGGLAAARRRRSAARRGDRARRRRGRRAARRAAAAATAPDRHAARARRPAARRPSSACASGSCRRSRRCSASALERDALQARGRSRPRALRRRDDLKTALLRVGLARPALAADRDPDRGRRARLASLDRRASERDELVDDDRRRGRAPVDARRQAARPVAAARPARAEPRVEWCSIEEVIVAAVDDVALPAGDVRAGARSRPAARPRRRRTARAGVRQPAGERRAATRAATRSRSARGAVGSRVLVRIVDRGPGHARRRARAHLRAVLPRAGERATAATAARASGWRSRAASSRPTAGAIWVESLPGPGDELRRRAAGRAPAPRERLSERPRSSSCDDEPQILRALKVILRDAGYEAIAAATVEEALDRAARAAARRGDHRPRAARRRRRRALPAAARVDADADHRAVGGRRGGRQGRRARRRRRRLRDQAVRPARAAWRGSRPRCAAPGRAPSEPAIVADGLRGRPRRARRCAATARRST